MSNRSARPSGQKSDAHHKQLREREKLRRVRNNRQREGQHVRAPEEAIHKRDPGIRTMLEMAQNVLAKIQHCSNGLNELIIIGRSSFF
jgi:hypothetical protein